MSKRQRDDRTSPSDVRQNIGMFRNNTQSADNTSYGTSWQPVMHAMQQENRKLQQENGELRNRLAATTRELENLKNNQKICLEHNETLKNSATQTRAQFEKAYKSINHKFMHLITQAQRYASSLINPNNRGINSHTLHVQTSAFLAFLQQMQQ